MEQEISLARCPTCGNEGTRNHIKMPKTIKGIMGEKELKRDEYWCKRCRRRFYPFDEQIGISKHATITWELQEVIVEASVHYGCFDK